MKNSPKNNFDKIYGKMYHGSTKHIDSNIREARAALAEHSSREKDKMEINRGSVRQKEKKMGSKESV